MIINRRINSVDIKICDSTQSLVELMSRIITEELDKGLCIVPGGRTPVKIFSHLSNLKCISSKSKLLLSDDRLVSIKSDKSNYKMLLDNLKISFENSLPLSYYDKLLEVGEFGLEQEISQILEENALNCAFLGVGSDGHTASLFPNKSLFESTQSAFKVMNNNNDFPRYTLSFKTIMKFKKIVFVISGIEKNFVLKELFSRENNFDNYPFQKLVMEHPNVLIVCDNAAGKDIG